MIAIGNSRRRGGFSLIEVIVGTALLAVIGLTIAGLFTKARQEVNSAGIMSRALSIAQHVAEDLDALPYEALRTSFPTIPTTATAAVVRFRDDTGAWQVRADDFVVNGSFNPAKPDYENEPPWKAGSNQYMAPIAVTDTSASGLQEPVRSWAADWVEKVAELPEGELDIAMICFFDVDDDNSTHVNPNTAPYTAGIDAAVMIRLDVTVRWFEGERLRSVTIPQARTFFEV